MHSFKFFTFVLTAAAPFTLVQDIEDPPILSCVDVECPYDGPEATCTVVNDTFIGIGLVAVPDLPHSLSGISLVKGVGNAFNVPNADDKMPPNNMYGPATYNSAYYLGTPASMDLSTLSGCSVVFHNAYSGLEFLDLY